MSDTSSDAADMMLAFRAGELAARLRHRPRVRGLSRDAAFDAVWRLLRARGLRVECLRVEFMLRVETKRS